MKQLPNKQPPDSQLSQEPRTSTPCHGDDAAQYDSCSSNYTYQSRAETSCGTAPYPADGGIFSGMRTLTLNNGANAVSHNSEASEVPRYFPVTDSRMAGKRSKSPVKKTLGPVVPARSLTKLPGLPQDTPLAQDKHNAEGAAIQECLDVNIENEPTWKSQVTTSSKEQEQSYASRIEGGDSDCSKATTNFKAHYHDHGQNVEVAELFTHKNSALLELGSWTSDPDATKVDQPSSTTEESDPENSIEQHGILHRPRVEALTVLVPADSPGVSVSSHQATQGAAAGGILGSSKRLGGRGGNHKRSARSRRTQRNGNNSDDDGEGSGDSGHGPAGAKKHKRCQPSTERWACPFSKHNPLHHKACGALKSGFTDIGRMKCVTLHLNEYGTRG